jgi:hypothetical protein
VIPLFVLPSTLLAVLASSTSGDKQSCEIVALCRPPPRQDWRRARTAGSRFARDDKEPGPSWGKQLPGRRPHETTESLYTSPQPNLFRCGGARAPISFHLTTPSLGKKGAASSRSVLTAVLPKALAAQSPTSPAVAVRRPSTAAAFVKRCVGRKKILRVRL